MDRSLSGKVAVVTGASSGIGLATARALADAGALLVVAARSTEKLKQAARDYSYCHRCHIDKGSR
jgi:NADP-dependent 3-hydroxy acid dehydrogenase YdfG